MSALFSNGYPQEPAQGTWPIRSAEHTSMSMDGVPLEPYTLRVTHVYRREDGEWKIVHHHGDPVPIDQSPPAEAPTT